MGNVRGVRKQGGVRGGTWHTISLHVARTAVGHGGGERIREEIMTYRQRLIPEPLGQSYLRQDFDLRDSHLCLHLAHLGWVSEGWGGWGGASQVAVQCGGEGMRE